MMNLWTGGHGDLMLMKFLVKYLPCGFNSLFKSSLVSRIMVISKGMDLPLYIYTSIIAFFVVSIRFSRKCSCSTASFHQYIFEKSLDLLQSPRLRSLTCHKIENISQHS